MMKMMYWSGLFLASFLAGHFAANPWMFPVGRILLFLKIYISVMFVLLLLSEVIPYILKHRSKLEEAFQRTTDLDGSNIDGGMQLSFASAGMVATAKRHEQQAVEDKEPVRKLMLPPPVRNEAAVAEVPVKQTETANEMTEQTAQTVESDQPETGQKEAETVLMDESEFMAAIRGLELLPSVENATAVVEETLEEAKIEDTRDLWGMENKEVVDDAGHFEEATLNSTSEPEEASDIAAAAENASEDLPMTEETTAERGTFETETGAISAADAGNAAIVEEEAVLDEAVLDEAVLDEAAMDEGVVDEAVLEEVALEERAAGEVEPLVIPADESQESFVLEGFDIPEFTSAIAGTGLAAARLGNVDVPDASFADESVAMEEAYFVEATPEAEVAAETAAAAENAAEDLPMAEEATAERGTFETETGAISAADAGNAAIVEEEAVLGEAVLGEAVLDEAVLDEAAMDEGVVDEAVLEEVVLEERVAAEVEPMVIPADESQESFVLEGFDIPEFTSAIAGTGLAAARLGNVDVPDASFADESVAMEEAYFVEATSEPEEAADTAAAAENAAEDLPMAEETTAERGTFETETGAISAADAGNAAIVEEETVGEEAHFEEEMRDEAAMDETAVEEEAILEETALEEHAAAEGETLVITAADSLAAPVEIQSPETDSPALGSGSSDIPESIDERIVVVEAIAYDTDAVDSNDERKPESDKVVDLQAPIETYVVLPDIAGVDRNTMSMTAVPQRYTCRLRCAKPGGLFRGPILKLYCKFICQNGNY